ncbi:hypothetical protein [Arthrobacter sp. 35W]|uniref:hypothetical protein n=1 Tax=Arthrobacter sp. 35W TaxID=1132441 RepID=UPI0004062696|nr:hypothetical protein [Arthrobacter sp. 35W]
MLKNGTLRLAAILLAVPALALGGCSSTPAAAPAGETTAVVQSPTPAPTEAAPPTDAPGLASTVSASMEKITSVSFTSDITAAGQTLKGTGHQKITNGRLEAARITQDMGAAGQMTILIAGGKLYITLPAAAGMTTADKPWLLVDETSTDPRIAALWTSMKGTLESSPLDQYSSFAQSAASVTLVGRETVNGVQATKYNVVVDASKLPAGSEERSKLEAAGLTTIPTDMWVDAQGRPVKFTQELTVQGQQVSTTITFGDYNSPVDIQAPAASEISPS